MNLSLKGNACSSPSQQCPVKSGSYVHVYRPTAVCKQGQVNTCCRVFHAGSAPACLRKHMMRSALIPVSCFASCREDANISLEGHVASASITCTNSCSPCSHHSSPTCIAE
jgi:hypothetical protein